MARMSVRLIKKIDMRENLYHVIQDCVVFSNTILVTQTLLGSRKGCVGVLLLFLHISATLRVLL